MADSRASGRGPLGTTDGGLPLQALYGPDDLPPLGSIGKPGEHPFTRGNFAGGYRDRLWTFRQYSGFGSAEDSNARYRYLLAQGGTGLSVALDLPTQCGYDSDDPEVEEEVGRVGVAIDTLADAELLFDQIPLDKISTSFTINGSAAILLAFYVAAAEKQGVRRDQLRGTTQNDILKEYASRGTWIWPPGPSMRLIGDTIEFCATDVPRFNAISVAGAHFRDAGASAGQEMAFTLADGVAYCDEVVSRGRMSIDDFAPQVSFFFYTHGDFFEEVAKYRAGRRRWAAIVRERYDAKDDRSLMFRVGCVCGGASLYAPQAENNGIRVAYEAMASVLGGVQSIFTAAWDEPFALPSEESTTLALRTQQILAYETGVARVVDPLGGSYFVEALTDRLEARAYEYFGKIDELGGMTEAVKRGFPQREIADAAYELQREYDSRERILVGVNDYTEGGDGELELLRIDAALERKQIGRVQAVRARRDAAAVEQALAGLREAAATDDRNLMSNLLDCARVHASEGEIVEALQTVFGTYTEVPVF